MFNIDQCERVDEREWYSLQEASKITGKSPASLRRLIQRKVFERVKKERSSYGEYWLIHRDELSIYGVHGAFNERGSVQGVHNEREEGVHVNTITFETYDQHRREWEHRCSTLEQGLLMYRYKFEEVDRQLKILPAPPEYVKAKIDELEKNLQEEARAKSLLAIEKAETEEEKEQLRKDYEDFLSQLRAKLSEEERIKEELKAELEKAMADLKRPWWKKLFGIK